MEKDKPWELYNKCYKDRWVRISTDGISRIGVLSESNYDYIILQPFLANETVSQEEKSLELRIENSIPLVISMPIRVIEPVSENYVKTLLKRYLIKHDDNQLDLLF